MSSSQHDQSSRHPLDLRRDKVMQIKDLVDRSAYTVPVDKVAAEIIREALVSLPPTHKRH